MATVSRGLYKNISKFTVFFRSNIIIYLPDKNKAGFDKILKKLKLTSIDSHIEAIAKSSLLYSI